MGAIDKVWRWFELPAVEATVYRCQNCGVELESDDRSCPDCGGDVQGVGDPVHYYWEPPH